ncbi:MAG TPA: TIM barrel protein, partial [Trueperaceae bacterium]|nr:TIM barrel protein [Trueperaceae bacterium]
DRGRVVADLAAAGLKLGVENHPEKTPAELRARLGEPHELIGVTIDTGWFATQGYDAAKAIEELADVLMYVHLKDVREAGSHDTCRYGEGVVPLRRCVEALRRVGYANAVCVEHEPETFDPSEDVRVSKELLEGWMAAA